MLRPDDVEHTRRRMGSPFALATLRPANEHHRVSLNTLPLGRPLKEAAKDREHLATSAGPRSHPVTLNPLLDPLDPDRRLEVAQVKIGVLDREAVENGFVFV